MTEEIHSCSYYCDRPECIRKQRDELREGIFSKVQAARENEKMRCALVCKARNMGDGTREDQEAERCATAILWPTV